MQHRLSASAVRGSDKEIGVEPRAQPWLRVMRVGELGALDRETANAGLVERREQPDEIPAPDGLNRRFVATDVSQSKLQRVWPLV